jgi:cytidylate kinase
MIDLSPYPNNIGKILNPQPNQFELDKKTIIRIFGLAGAGKGTLAKQLVDYYNIDNLETSYILRSATYIYLELMKESPSIEFNKENTKAVFDQIYITFSNKKLHFSWFRIHNNTIQLTDTELRSNEVQAKVAIFSGDSFFRNEYYKKINYILNELVDKSVILDGRGSNTPYLNQAEADGFKIIRIFLWAGEESSYQRYKTAYIERNNLQNSFWTNDINLKCKSEFKTNIADRNIQDYENAVSNNLGLLTAETGIIDTSDLTPIQVLQIAVDFIQSKK